MPASCVVKLLWPDSKIELALIDILLIVLITDTNALAGKERGSHMLETEERKA